MPVSGNPSTRIFSQATSRPRGKGPPHFSGGCGSRIAGLVTSRAQCDSTTCIPLTRPHVRQPTPIRAVALQPAASQAGEHPLHQATPSASNVDTAIRRLSPRLWRPARLQHTGLCLPGPCPAAALGPASAQLLTFAGGRCARMQLHRLRGRRGGHAALRLYRTATPSRSLIG